MKSLIKKLLRENIMGSINKWYRGVDSEYGAGSSPHSWVWITDDIDHASNYGDSIVVFDFDYDKYHLKIAYNNIKSLLEEYAKSIGSDDYIYNVLWDPNESFVNFMKSKGYIGYHFEGGDGDRVCIFDKSLLSNMKVIKK